MPKVIRMAQLQVRFMDGSVATFDATPGHDHPGYARQWITVKMHQEDEELTPIDIYPLNDPRKPSMPPSGEHPVFVVTLRARQISCQGMEHFG